MVRSAVVYLGILLLVAAGCAPTAPGVEAEEFDVSIVDRDDTRSASSNGGVTSNGATAQESDRQPTPTPIPLPSVAAVPEPTVEECVVETVEDEYGFEVVISSCDAPVAGAPESFIEMADFIGSRSADNLLAGIRDRLILQSGCAGGVIEGVDLIPGPLVRDAARAIPDADVAAGVQEVFGALSAIDDACDDAGEWVNAVRDALVKTQALEGLLVDFPGDVLVSREGELDDLTLVTADVVAQYDRLYAALTGVRAIEGSDLWYSSNHLMHVRGLRALQANDLEPPILAMGSSVIARSVDPLIMSDQLGTDVMNLALLGSSVPIHVGAIDQFLAMSEEPKTILWGEVSHRYFRGDCQVPEVQRIEGPLLLQDNLFVGVEDLLGDTAKLDLLFGSDRLNPTYANTPILERGISQFGGVWDLGAFPELTKEPDAESMAQQALQYAAVYERPVVCELQLAIAIDAVERWVADGHTVVAFAAPLSQALADLHPQRRDAHDELIVRLAAEHEAAGATYLDLSGILEDSAFGDPTHPNAKGRVIVTAALIEALNSRG